MAPAVLTIGVVATAFAMWIGSRRQQRASSAQADRLIAAAASSDLQRFDPDGLDPVPPPVARYLRLALPPNYSIRLVRISQTGSLRTDVHSDRWMAFEAEHIAAPAAGFLWNARIPVAPMLHIAVRDAFIEGQGSGQVSLMSTFTLAADAGTPEMNSGSMHRFLAEAVWYPTALLPSAKLRWTPVDDSRAVATMTDHGISVSLEFRFTDTGEVTGIYTPARWGKFGGGFRQVAWEGHFREYRRLGDLMAPTEGEVGWHVDDQWRCVWKGTITGFDVQSGT